MLLRDDMSALTFPYILGVTPAGKFQSSSSSSSSSSSPTSNPSPHLPPLTLHPRKTILLWCAPRSVSTAFERAFISHPQTHVLHEPFSIPYHFGPDGDRLCPRFEGKSEVGFRDVCGGLRALRRGEMGEVVGGGRVREGREVVFVKELAYCVTEACGGRRGCEGGVEGVGVDLGSLERDVLRNVERNTFIIRDPKQQIMSLYRQMRRAHPGWEMDATKLWEESGVGQLYFLWKVVRERCEGGAVVVDADDLREDPEGVITGYCREVGVEFVEGMLHWEEGMPEQWKVWGDRGWHDNAVKSRGIGKIEKKDGEREEEVFPDFVHEVVDRCRPIYSEMWETRLRV
ncbi:hypothetical protein HDV00_012722 [Rhizophlyctis rosea]|nr:hypothetical protein HDV00_012722 [Rhizophlyctis rosea]